MLLVVAAGIGTGMAFNTPAWDAVIPDLVNREELAAAVTLGSIALNLSRAIGPALAGALIAALGPAACFSLNALSFFAVLLLLVKSWKPIS